MKKDSFMKLEDYGWGFKNFERLKGRELIEDLQIFPLLSKDEIEKCFILTQKVERFIKDIEFKNYLFLSLAGTGKTSLLSYLSTLANRRGYRVFWVVIENVVPNFEVFIKRINLKKISQNNLILVFDNIHKNLEVITLISKIIQEFPEVKIWISARYYDTLFLKEEWKEIKEEFKILNLPGLLEKEDIKRFLKRFKGILNKEEENLILKKVRLPAIHLTSLYQNLKKVKSKEERINLIKGTPLKAYEVYLSIYRSLTDSEKFILKLIAYQDGILENSLQKAVKIFGIREKVIKDLMEKQIIYKDPHQKFLPSLQEFASLNIIDGIKEIILLSEYTFPYERENIIPEILIKIGTIEEMIALSRKYAQFNPRQKKEYKEILKKGKDNISIFWLISNLAGEGEEEFLKYSNYKIKYKESKFEKELYARALGNFGYAYYIKKDFKNSIKCFKKAISVYPKSSRLWFNLGIVYGAEGKINEEILCYREALKIDPQSETAWYNLGLAYDKRGFYNEEIKCFKEALRINPKNFKSWYNLGIVYGKKGWIHEEMECYEEALALNPEDIDTWYNLGIVYTEKEEYQKAKKCFKEALKINPKDVYCWYNLGIVYGRLNEVEKEIEAFKKVVTLMPSFAKAWYNLGMVYEEEGEIEKEKEAYENVVRINPNWIEAWYNLALAYWKMGEIEKEIKCYQKIEELDPKFILS